MERMARPRLLLPGILACLCLSALLSGCGDKARAPAPAAIPRPSAAGPASSTHPAPARETVAPQWRPNVPVIATAEVEATLRAADAALARGQVERGRSPGPGALELYLAVLAVAPRDERAQSGVQACVDALLELGRLAMRAGRLDEAARAES